MAMYASPWAKDTTGKLGRVTAFVLADGTKFDGPGDLREALLTRPEQFAMTVTEKLLTYALGRDVESYDQPAIRKILREAAPSDYRWSSLLIGIAESTPFQMRRAQQP